MNEKKNEHRKKREELNEWKRNTNKKRFHVLFKRHTATITIP